MALPNINWQQLNSVLGSKALENILGIGGAAMTAKSQADQRTQDREQGAQQLSQNAAQFRANLLQRQQEQQQQGRDQRAGTVLGQSRLGENEQFATKNRILRALLPSMQARRSVAADPAVAAMMPKTSGGLGNFRITPEMLEAMSERATSGAIGQRAKQFANVDSSAPMPDMQGMGLDPTGEQQTMLDKYAQLRAQTQASDDDRIQQLIMQALGQDQENEQSAGKPAPEGMEYDKKTGQLKKKGGGFLGGLKKVAGFALPLAASFIPGVGPLVAAGMGAAGGALSGGAKGAALGGVTGYAGNVAGNMRKKPVPYNTGRFD